MASGVSSSADTRRVSDQIENSKHVRTMQLAQARPNVRATGPYLYAIYVINLEKKIAEKVFGFDIPPKAIRVSEPFSNDVAAGQEGGFWVDERGQYFKELAISGSFGFRPTRRRRDQPNGGVAGALPTRVINSAQQVQQVAARVPEAGVAGVPKLPEAETTGFDRIRMLTNIFRFYGEKKKYRKTAPNYEMVWANWKTGEVYWCQPLRFDTDRTAPSGKFQTNYAFSLRLLRPVEVFIPDDYWKNPNSGSGRPAWMQKLRQAAAVLDAAQNVVNEVVNGSLNFGRDVVDSVLRPIDATVNAIKTLVNVGHAVLDFPLEILRQAHRSSLNLAEVFYAAEEYSDVGARWGREFRKIAQAYAAAWTGLKFVSQGDPNDEAAAYNRKYNGPFFREEDPEVAYGRTNPRFDYGESRIPRGKRTEIIPNGTNIRSLAEVYLGDSVRWREIVLLNNLQYPYIDPSGNGKTVLRPGDRILIPEELGTGPSGIINTGRKDPDNFDFGWDLRVDPQTGKFVVDASGDLDIVGGKDNLRQAMVTKVRTRPGDLVLHPWFGFEPVVGQALDVDTIALQNLQLKNTVLSDTRIEEIKYISFKTLGDQLFVSVVLTPKNQDTEVALSTLRVGLPSGV